MQTGLSVSQTARLLGFKHTTISGFTRNGPRKRKYPADCFHMIERQQELKQAPVTTKERNHGPHQAQLLSADGRNLQPAQAPQWDSIGLMGVQVSRDLHVGGSGCGANILPRINASGCSWSCGGDFLSTTEQGLDSPRRANTAPLCWWTVNAILSIRTNICEERY